MKTRCLFTVFGMLAACWFTPASADLDAGLLALANQDYPTAKKEFQAAADQGNSEAQYSLGHMFESGEGMARDFTEAFKWYLKSAQQGFKLAQNNLGYMYENGQGVARNYAEAVKWFRKAAEQGYALAQYNLGRIYAQGQGVTQDYEQAYLWTALSAAQGDEGAIKNMNLLAARMTQKQIAAAQELVASWLKEHTTTKEFNADPNDIPDSPVVSPPDESEIFRL